MKTQSSQSPTTMTTHSKSSSHGLVNGLSNGKKNSIDAAGLKGTKKREHVWMDVSDHEAEKRTLKVNGNGTHTSPGKRNARKRTRSSLGNANGNHAGVLPDAGHAALQEQRKQLPIARGKEALIQEIHQNDVTVLLGETGSGKTTQVPQYLLESGISGTGMIAVTQPRKVAATTLAARVASEQGVTTGTLVGYSVRFDESCSAQTRIKYLTDGMIIRELLSDPLLSRYSVIIVDEAHERTLRTDILISNLKTIQQSRNKKPDIKGKGPASKSNPLKIIIMSATLDAEKFSKFFHNAKILYVRGRQHPVQIFHTASGQTDYLDAALRTFFQIHTDPKHQSGDVLIFLPGQEDIENLEKSIQLFANQLPAGGMGVTTCPMYAALPPGQQTKMFSAALPNTRKCILATNIAETSITIPGIKYVIDTGKCKEKRFLHRDTGGGFDTLMTKDITQSSAMQRAGRAGREGQGFCYRLYTEASFNAMAPSVEPEIRRCSLTSCLLQLKCLSQDLEELDLMDQPDLDAVITAFKTLYLLGALDVNKSLTTLGREMAAFPLEPNYARVIMASKEYGCCFEVLEIISVLSASSKLFFDTTDQRESAADARRKFRHPSGDHWTLLNAFKSYQEIAKVESRAGRHEWCRKHFLNERTLLEAIKIREQLRTTCSRLHIDWRTSCGDDEEPVLKSLGHGLLQNTALLQPDQTYKQMMGQNIIKIHPGSTMCDKKVPLIIYDELVYTTQIYARGVSSVPKRYIQSIATLSNSRH